VGEASNELRASKRCGYFFKSGLQEAVRALVHTKNGTFRPNSVAAQAKVPTSKTRGEKGHFQPKLTTKKLEGIKKN
jgi:hypothetical protein